MNEVTGIKMAKIINMQSDIIIKQTEAMRLLFDRKAIDENYIDIITNLMTEIDKVSSQVNILMDQVEDDTAPKR